MPHYIFTIYLTDTDVFITFQLQLKFSLNLDALYFSKPFKRWMQKH